MSCQGAASASAEPCEGTESREQAPAGAKEPLAGSSGGARVVGRRFMSLADRLKMFEKAASDAAGPGHAGAAPAKRPVWGAARGPSLAEQIKKVSSVPFTRLKRLRATPSSSSNTSRTWRS